MLCTFKFLSLQSRVTSVSSLELSQTSSPVAEQCVKIREPLVRGSQQLGVEFLKHGQMLAVQGGLLAVEMALRLHASVHLWMELFYVLVLLLMDVQLVLHAGQVGTVIRVLELLDLRLAPVDAVVQRAEVRVRVDQSGLVHGGHHAFLDRERDGRKRLYQTFVKKRSQRDPPLM